MFHIMSDIPVPVGKKCAGWRGTGATGGVRCVRVCACDATGTRAIEIRTALTNLLMHTNCLPLGDFLNVLSMVVMKVNCMKVCIFEPS